MLQQLKVTLKDKLDTANAHYVEGRMGRSELLNKHKEMEERARGIVNHYGRLHRVDPNEISTQHGIMRATKENVGVSDREETLPPGETPLSLAIAKDEFDSWSAREGLAAMIDARSVDESWTADTVRSQSKEGNWMQTKHGSVRITPATGRNIKPDTHRLEIHTPDGAPEVHADSAENIAKHVNKHLGLKESDIEESTKGAVLAHIKNNCPSLTAKYDSDNKEWAIKERGAKDDEGTYYTNDHEDAMATATRMHKRFTSHESMSGLQAMLGEAGAIPAAVQGYIDRTRNAQRKEYAQEYAKWKAGGEKNDPPNSPEIGYMARQGVRLSIDDLWNTDESEKVLWGVKAGDPDWDEVVLSTRADKFEQIKAIAAKQGYGRFRVAAIDMKIAPDFTKTVRKDEAIELDNYGEFKGGDPEYRAKAMLEGLTPEQRAKHDKNMFKFMRDEKARRYAGGEHELGARVKHKLGGTGEVSFIKRDSNTGKPTHYVVQQDDGGAQALGCGPIR